MRIVCVLKTGGEFLPAHVNVLLHACRRWFRGHDFICLTDAPALDCKVVPFKTNLPGWWAKMELFDSFRDGETLYFDLDTIIRGGSGAFMESLAAAGDFAILRDVYRGSVDKHAMQSSLMFWRGDHSWIWESFKKKGQGHLRGDQDFLEFAFREAGRLPTYFQDFTQDVASFKAHIDGQKAPSKAPIVCFHGNPRPWAQTVIHYPALPPVDMKEPCVVVGNGPSIVGQRLGSVIDAFPHIVRINAYRIKGFEIHAGTRTTLHATHGKDGGVSVEPSPGRVLWVHGNAAWSAAESWQIPRSFFWDQVAGWSPENKILPSTGLVTVAWLLQQGVPVVHLVGFDHFSKSKRHEHHYWHKHAMLQPPEHAPDREAAKFAQWQAEGRVKYL